MENENGSSRKRSRTTPSSVAVNEDNKKRQGEELEQKELVKRQKNGGHRRPSEVWAIISDGSVPMVHMKPIVVCRFCGCEVHTSAKPSRAITHLQRKCTPGRAFLDSIPVAERSHFITTEFYSSGATLAAQAEVWRWVSNEPEAPLRNELECKHCSEIFLSKSKPLRALQHLKRCPQAKAFFQSLPANDQTAFTLEHFQEQQEKEKPKRTSRKGQEHAQGAEQTRFSELMALFFYSSGIPLQCSDSPYLREALAMCCHTGGELAVPSKGMLGGRLLNDMHARASEALAQEEGASSSSGITKKVTKEMKLQFLREHHSLALPPAPPQDLAVKTTPLPLPVEAQESVQLMLEGESVCL